MLAASMFVWAGRPAVATAQSFEEEPIVSLEVNSRVGMTLESLGRLTGIRTGLPYSSRAVRRSLDALYATGLFSDVEVEVSPIEGGVAVIYDFTEKAYLADLQFTGNRVFSDRKLAEAMGLDIGEEFTDDRWKKAINLLVQFLQGQGYMRARVDTDVQLVPGTNQAKVTVRVSEGPRARIKSVDYVGDTVYSDFRLWWQATRSAQGEFYRADVLDGDVSRLEKLYLSNGYLQAIVGPPEIRYDEATNEVAITVPINAGTQLRVRFEGNAPYPDNRLSPLLLFAEERNYDEGVFRASADRIAEFYRQQGYPFAKVEYTREELLSENAIQAVFIIHPGNFACLRSVLFYGNTFFSAEQLQEMIVTRPGNTLFCGTVVEDRMDGDADILRARYHQEGFQDSKIEPRVEYNPDKTVAYLIFAVGEGPRTLVSEIGVEGEHALTESDVLKPIRMSAGMPYDEIPLRKDMEDILFLYHQNGYVYAKIRPQLDFSEDRTRVSIRFQITEGDQVHIGRILITGNTYTKENVIRREVLVKPGDPYNETLIQTSRHRIQQLGFLGDVRFEPIIPISRDNPQTIKDMRLSVQERPPKVLDFGFGYADVEHLRGFVQVTHRNLWGTGRSISFRADGSSIESRYSAIYREPWAFGLNMDGALAAYDETLDRPTYKIHSLGTTATLSKKFTPIFRGSVQYKYENNRYKQGVDLLSEDERANIGSITPSFYWDTRNDPFTPTSGFLNGISFQDAALSLGSQIQFLSTGVQSNWYLPIARWLVFAVSARGGAANRYGETKTDPVFGDTVLVPPDNRFYLGGRTTIRGFPQDLVGVVNQTEIANDDGSGVDFTGGNSMLLFNGEFRIFLPKNLGISIFNDRGNVYRSLKQVDVNEFRNTIGAGIWYGTPVGPIRLDYGYKMNRRTNLCVVPNPNPGSAFIIEKVSGFCGAPVEESKSEFHFTIGFAF
jgi:outer membrane protein insertion porin family